MSVQGRAYVQLIGGRTPGSKLPASPPSLLRPNGGGQPGRVPVYTALKKATRQRASHQPVHETMPTAELTQILHCLDQPRHLSLHNNRHVNDSVQHRSCNCGITTVSSQTAPRNLPDLHNQHQQPCQCTVTGESQWSLKSETMEAVSAHRRGC